jgi:hypothetical protein
MKVGIITFHRGNANYGSALQALCLKQAIEQLGHEAYIIDYVPLRSYVHSILKRLFQPSQLYHFWQCCRAQKKFLKPHLTPAFSFYNQRVLSHYDALVTGSDEVWKINIVRGLNPAYFLATTSPAPRKISYAASYCNTPVFESRLKEIRPLLAQLDHVSVREESTAAMVENQTGKKPAIVLDPSLLHEKPYSETRGTPLDTPYLYAYIEEQISIAYGQELIAYASQRGLKIVSYNRQRALEGSGYIYPHCCVEEWTEYFRHASAVFTTTYHGVCLSVHYQRSFVYAGNALKAYKTDYLLQMLGLNDRSISAPSQMKTVFETCVSWETAQAKLAQMRQYSMDFLNHALA